MNDPGTGGPLGDLLAVRGRGGDPIEAILGLVREHLDMDVAVVTEFVGDRQVHRAIAGDAESFGMRVGHGPRLEATYCARMVQGEIPQAIPDTQANEVTADLPVTGRANIGSYVGVPIELPDGRLFGTFCCVSHDAHRRLDERDAGFMRLLATVLGEHLEVREARRRRQQAIERILTSDTTVMALQPIVNVLDGRVAGVEALARFPEAGLPPDVVFQQAHDVGLGTELELLAIRKATGLLDDVPQGGYLSVNIGPTALLDAGFSATMREASDLNRVCLELTEHTSVERYGELAEMLFPLRRDGMRVAIDDVGAGYASLRHVLQVQPDILKIDRSLVIGVAADAARRSIITSIVLLALELGATVVAEGVETAEDARGLADLGVDMMQGYLFARPSSDRQDWLLWHVTDPYPVAHIAPHWSLGGGAG